MTDEERAKFLEYYDNMKKSIQSIKESILDNLKIVKEVEETLDETFSKIFKQK
jgi:hypothetical protein